MHDLALERVHRFERDWRTGLLNPCDGLTSHFRQRNPPPGPVAGDVQHQPTPLTGPRLHGQPSQLLQRIQDLAIGAHQPLQVATSRTLGHDRDLKRLVGADGEVLDALQELTRLAVQARTGERSRLMLDIAGYRAGRRVALAEVAREAIARVQETGAPVSLEAMNPFERKVVHDVVAAAGLVSDSEGEEPDRHVVIHPAAVASS